MMDPIIPVPRMLRQEDNEFKVSLGCILKPKNTVSKDQGRDGLVGKEYANCKDPRNPCNKRACACHPDVGEEEAGRSLEPEE